MQTNDIAGSFYANLNRNNSKIRGDRAIAITEDAQLLYKRELEDMEMRLKRLTRERESMLDLSPTSADSLILASDFNAESFVKKDIDLGVQVRNLEIMIGIAKERYSYLFTGDTAPELLTEAN
jgi:hypothetical protein